MADNVWDNSDGDNDGNVAANWSLGNVPTTGDVAVFDSATTNANCTFSGNLSCDGMRFDGTYSGTVDAATYDITLGTDGLDCTGGGSATLDLGSGTWTCSGDWDDADIGTLTWGSSTLVMDTDSTSIITASAKHKNNVKISANVSQSGWNNFRGTLVVDAGKTYTINNFLQVYGEQTINGTVDINGASYELRCRSPITVNSGGTVTGTGKVKAWVANAHIWNNGGTWSPALTLTERSLTIKAGTYQGDFECDAGADGQTLTIGGSVTFTGNVTFRADRSLDTYTVAVTSDNDITFQGNATWEESNGATLVWTAGEGTMIFSGSNNQTVTTPSGWTDELEELQVNKTAGDFTQAGNITCDSFVYTDSGTGKFTPSGYDITTTGSATLNANCDMATASTAMNGLTWTVGGAFTCDGQTFNATSAWDLDVTGAATANGTGSVAYSDASTGTEVSASGWTDNGNNTNWNFGSAVSPKAMHYKQLMSA